VVPVPISSLTVHEDHYYRFKLQQARALFFAQAQLARTRSLGLSICRLLARSQCFPCRKPAQLPALSSFVPTSCFGASAGLTPSLGWCVATQRTQLVQTRFNVISQFTRYLSSSAEDTQV
jgi:hypothetical protein